MAKKKRTKKLTALEKLKMAAGLVGEGMVVLAAADVIASASKSRYMQARTLYVGGVEVRSDDRLELGEIKFRFREGYKEIFSIPGLEKMIAEVNSLIVEQSSTELFG
jgi:hypothetical protein